MFNTLKNLLTRLLKKQKIRVAAQTCLFLIAAIGLILLWLPRQSVTSAQVIQFDSGPSLLVAKWGIGTNHHDLKRWTPRDLARFKMSETKEIDPITRKNLKWRGVAITKLVDEALVGLPVESQALFDLVILEGASGQRAFLPRAFINKFPVLLALQWSPSDRDLKVVRNPPYSVVPWTSKPKTHSEDLPIESFFVPQVVKIELTNYKELYGSLFLKRRTDPLAIYGEKLFVQSCVNCHLVKRNVLPLDFSNQNGISRFSAGQHPKLSGVVKLNERSRRSILRYLSAYQEENAVSLNKNVGALSQ